MGRCLTSLHVKHGGLHCTLITLNCVKSHFSEVTSQLPLRRAATILLALVLVPPLNCGFPRSEEITIHLPDCTSLISDFRLSNYLVCSLFTQDAAAALLFY